MVIKLLNEWCFECLICVMFFSLLLIVLIKVFFFSKILLVIFISEFFILFLILVISCMLLRKRFLNRVWFIYFLFVYSFFLMFFRNLFCFNGFWLFMFLGVNMKLRILFLLLIIRCSLNLKNYFIEYFLCLVSFLNVLWIKIFWLWYIYKGVELMKLMLV